MIAALALGIEAASFANGSGDGSRDWGRGREQGLEQGLEAGRIHREQRYSGKPDGLAGTHKKRLQDHKTTRLQERK